MVKIGIYGFNRTARSVIRIAAETDINAKIVKINTKNAETQYMAYQLRYDSVYGRFPGRIEDEQYGLTVGNTKIIVSTNEQSWDDCDVVIDCENDGNVKNAEKIVFSGRTDNAAIVDYGINHKKVREERRVCQIKPCASAIGILGAIVNRTFGMENAVAITDKAADEQSVFTDCDNAEKWRSGRAADSLIPEVCGGVQGAETVFPEIKGLIAGQSLRTPARAVSNVSLVCCLKSKTNYNEVAEALKRASEKDFEGILGVTDESVVSCDFIGCPLTVTADIRTIISHGRMVKISGWYDGTRSHAYKLLKLAEFMGS